MVVYCSDTLPPFLLLGLENHGYSKGRSNLSGVQVGIEANHKGV